MRCWRYVDITRCRSSPPLASCPMIEHMQRFQFIQSWTLPSLESMCQSRSQEVDLNEMVDYILQHSHLVLFDFVIARCARSRPKRSPSVLDLFRFISPRKLKLHVPCFSALLICVVSISGRTFVPYAPSMLHHWGGTPQACKLTLGSSPTSPKTAWIPRFCSHGDRDNNHRNNHHAINPHLFDYSSIS